MSESLIGKRITLRPTQGGYQKEQRGMIIHETSTRIIVRFESLYRLRTYIKETGEPYSKADAEFPRYVAVMDSIA